MFRRCPSVFAAAAVATAPAVAAKPSKMQTLHKILTGEVALKGKALVKDCNIVAVFGDSWQAELTDYAKSLSEAERTVLNRQVARLNLTRYTTRELADFGGNGPENVDAAAKAYNNAKGAQLLAAAGEAKFVEMVKAEAKLARWSDAEVAKYIAEVKSAKK